MRKLGSLIVAVALVAPVSASAAWVLWNQIMKPNTAPAWIQVSAHESKGECEREKAPAVGLFHETVKKMKPGPENPGGKIVTTENGVAEYTREGRLRAAMSWECWPDTVAPRGPKGGVR